MPSHTEISLPVITGQTLQWAIYTYDKSMIYFCQHSSFIASDNLLFLIQYAGPAQLREASSLENHMH